MHAAAIRGTGGEDPHARRAGLQGIHAQLLRAQCPRQSARTTLVQAWRRPRRHRWDLCTALCRDGCRPAWNPEGRRRLPSPGSNVSKRETGIHHAGRASSGPDHAGGARRLGAAAPGQDRPP